MPPVLSPVSLSPARLWSIDETIGTTVSPSVKESTDTSGPVRNSSITILFPLSPKAFSSIIRRTASSASSRVFAIITPLPRASPSALITVGRGASLIYSSASRALSNTLYSAVGMPYFFIRFLANTLLLSIAAAALVGPKQGMPQSLRASTAPSARGSS